MSEDHKIPANQRPEMHSPQFLDFRGPTSKGEERGDRKEGREGESRKVVAFVRGKEWGGER